MRTNKYRSRFMLWVTASMLCLLAAGCGGGGSGGSGQSPILGFDNGIATLAPAVTAVSPAAGSVGVPVTTTIITAAFNKAMDPASLNKASFTLACPGTAPLLDGVVSYNPVGNVAVLTLPGSANLPASTICTATVTSAVKDTFGITLASNFTWLFTTGLAPDTIAPTVTSTNIANGATDVSVNTSVSASFSESLNAVTVNRSSFTLKQGLVPVAGSVSYAGVTAVFTPDSALTLNTVYTATIQGGAQNGVKDLAGNPMVNDYVWSWTTSTGLDPNAGRDTTPPTVISTINANGATNVSTNTKVGASFSESMDPARMTNANFMLKDAVTNVAVAGTVSYSGVSVVFTPLASLAPSTRYTATLKGAPDGVSDLAGNRMVNDYIWSWTTGANPDTIAPTVISVSPVELATNVPVTTSVSAMFSEAMDPLTMNSANVSVAGVNGLVSYDAASKTVTYKPTTALAENTTYTATVSTGVKDIAGNAMASNKVWTFTTAKDTTPPTVISTINANGATNVSTNTKVGASFSESMDPARMTNANFMLKDAVTNVAVAGTVSYSGVSVVFTPLASLAPSTRYTATLKGAPDGVSDLAGNRMVNDYIWSWTTGANPDTIAPTVISVSPVELATNVPVTTSVSAMFSEAMDPLTMNSANVSVAGVNGLVSYDAASKTVTYKPTTALAENTTYTATVSTGVKDIAGNAMASNKVWTFTTAKIIVLPATVNLGAAASYGSFGGTAGMTNMGTLTVINGNIGTTATGTSSVTGYHDTGGDIYTETGSNRGTVNGSINTCTTSTTGPTAASVSAPKCALATQARLDAQAAYLFLAGKPPGANPGANLAGKTLAPGVYTAPSGSFMIEGGNLTLDAQGDANAQFIFQMATTLTVGGPGAAFPQSIVLAGGAQAKNVFWQVGSFATINAGGGGTMVGTIISMAGVSFSTAGNVNIVTLNGRALSLGASVTLVNTVINVP